MKIDELKHALSLHHEVEGDTLLSDYAEKDIELICGSLVTVRQETLQVIHLTVKEFLTNTSGRQQTTYSGLLIDPAKASLNLTLACLKCIHLNCDKPLARLDPDIARLDIKIDVEAVIHRQRQAPLMEYASLVWMMHLIDCDGAQMIRVSKAFQETFNSPLTFHWVEACMAFQPDSVLHLLAGLEEVIDHISGLGPEYWDESEASCVFFADWCHALRNVFEEYALTLVHRPWDVHFLDFQIWFSKMENFYERFGDISRRDTTVRIDGYESPRSCRPEAQAHTRLQQDVQGSHSSIFFIHDERRRLYFWGEGSTDYDNVRLFVQNATTGQRLPPAVKLGGDAGWAGNISGYGMSPSGAYIVVVYSNSIDHLTLIWQVNEEISFKRRMRSQPWARIIFSHQCKNALFSTTENAVVFTDGGHCLTPSGAIHLASGSQRPLFDHISILATLDESGLFDSFYSQNGQYLFISRVTYDGDDPVCWAIRVALFTETSEHLCSWKPSSHHLVDVSPSGRFLVLSSEFQWASMKRADKFLYIYDVDTSETIQLPCFAHVEYFEAKFQFVKDETELIVFISSFISGVSAMNVWVWSDLQSDPALKSYGQLKMDARITPSEININKDESSALMVSENRVIQRMEFRTQVRFSDAPDVNDDFPCAISQISKDGARWALLKYGRNKAQLQMTDVSSVKGPIYRLDLELSPWDEPDSRAATFSPDLSVLVVDAQVFIIAKGLHGLTSASFAIQGLAELLVQFRTGLNPRYWCQLRCLISPCKSYIIFISPGDTFQGKIVRPTIYLFRIDLVSRSSTRLHLRLPKDLTYVSADFHPSQQLMLLSYSSSFSDQVLENVSSSQISIVELDSLEMKPISLPENEIFMERLRK